MALLSLQTTRATSGASRWAVCALLVLSLASLVTGYSHVTGMYPGRHHHKDHGHDHHTEGHGAHHHTEGDGAHHHTEGHGAHHHTEGHGAHTHQRTLDQHTDHTYLVAEQDINSPDYDVVVVITDSVDNLVGHQLSPIKTVVEKYLESDKVFGSPASLILTDAVRAGTLIYVNTGPLDRDFIDDVRRFEDAAVAGVSRLHAAGKTKPLLAVPRTEKGTYSTDLLVSVLAALQGLYLPLEVKEGGYELRVQHLGVWGADPRTLGHTVRVASAIEEARIVARDICASDPERMAPPKVESYLRRAFNNTPSISMEVISDWPTLEKDYPLMAAASRAANSVERHKARLIYMEYTPRGPVNQTLFLVGKGVTYDTGGADIKIMGSMESMHRDKCGAAAVAGFMKVLSIVRPAHLRVVAAMPYMRNSVGEEGYVTDEIITARSGLKVRVGNTDAEGRMIMADVLCRVKELAVDAVNPHIFTIATLTGHAKRTVGGNYFIAMDNGPARAAHTAESLSVTGDLFGDPLEVSRLRRDDFRAHMSSSMYEDLVSSDNTVSTRSNRGHQTPAAFLMQVSKLYPHHGTKSSIPLPYTHMDIAGPASLYPGVPGSSPVVMLTAHYLLSDEDKRRLARSTRELPQQHERRNEPDKKMTKEKQKASIDLDRFFIFRN